MSNSNNSHIQTQNRKSKANSQDKKEEKKNEAQLVLEAIKRSQELVFFHDQYNEPYVRFPHKEGKINVPLGNGLFRSYLDKIASMITGKALTKENQENVLRSLKSQCLYFNAQQHHLEVRIAKHENDFLYDLIGKTIRISAQGIEICNNDNLILFRYFNLLKKQIEPAHFDSLNVFDDFLDLFNLPSPHDRLLLKVWIITGYIPEIAHPILALYGPQGSAKSTLMKMLLDLIDPAHTESINSSNAKEIFREADHRYVLPLDNLTQISGELSDTLCTLVTGAGRTERKLYTDGDDIIRRFRRLIILNGVNLPMSKPDLIDRSIMLPLERIEEEFRREEREIWDKFHEMKPKLLSAIFHVIHKAMLIHPTISLPTKPRMADFAVWASAVTKAMGQEINDFLDSIKENANRQNIEAIEESPLATTIKYFFEVKRGNILVGTPTKLRDLLCSLCEEAGIDKRTFPTSARSFGKLLSEIKPNLKAIGYSIEATRSGERIITITPKHSNSNVVNVETSLTDRINAKTAFSKLIHALKQTGDQIPPRMDNISARTVNRMGGWPAFCDASISRGPILVEEEFTGIFEEFIQCHSNGHYEGQLPVTVEGRTCKITAQCYPSDSYQMQ
jgi:energy-coupling factor transporter ATP-binding protein EcfA2